MSGTKITRFLPNNEYQAAISAAAPTALNPFATIADITAATNWQAVMSNGSSATITTNAVLSTTGIIDFESASGNDISNIVLQHGVQSGLSYENITGAQAIQFDGTTMLILDSINSKGIETAADYSAGYSVRSYTDKNYQDTHLGGKDVTALITGPLVGQDGYAVTWDNTAAKYTLTAPVAGTSIYNADGNTSVTTRVVSIQDVLAFRDNTGVTSYLSIRNSGQVDINALSGRWNLGVVSAGNVKFKIAAGAGDTFSLLLQSSALVTNFVVQNVGHTIVGANATGNLGVGLTSTAVPASRITSNGDIEIIGGTKGTIYEDRTTGQRTRWFVDNGTFQQENV